ncbi:hypothetical protein IL306_006784, partial [Fusarium sp. DS 682]
MDVSRYAAKPEAYDTLSAYQIAKFCKEHGLARDEFDCFATNLLGSPVSATPVQGATSYTVSGDEAGQVVQFRRSQLPMRHIEVAKQLYGDFVPECKSRGMFGPVYVYVANLVPGPAFCRVRSQFFSPAPTMELRLQQTVQDFARSDATSMAAYVRGSTNLPILDEVSPGLPAQLQATLDDVRQELPRLFQPRYPMVLQHDDLLVNNIHVDEATGHIT